MSEIRVNGVGLYYEEHGSGDPILCIHGTGSSTALWREPATRLAAHGRTIVYDRRGFGASERPDPFVTSVREQADDAAALLDALDAAPTALTVGTPWIPNGNAIRCTPGTTSVTSRVDVTSDLSS